MPWLPELPLWASLLSLLILFPALFWLFPRPCRTSGTGKKPMALPEGKVRFKPGKVPRAQSIKAGEIFRASPFRFSACAEIFCASWVLGILKHAGFFSVVGMTDYVDFSCQEHVGFDPTSLRAIDSFLVLICYATSSNSNNMSRGSRSH